MTAYRDTVYGAGVIVTFLYGSLQGQSLWCRVIVTGLYGSLKDRVYGARVIVTSLYGSLQGMSLWFRSNCNEFVWQL